MSELIELKNVEFEDFISFPQLIIAEDKTTFLMGKSGSGKSHSLQTAQQNRSLLQGRYPLSGARY